MIQTLFQYETRQIVVDYTPADGYDPTGAAAELVLFQVVAGVAQPPAVHASSVPANQGGQWRITFMLAVGATVPGVYEPHLCLTKGPETRVVALGRVRILPHPPHPH